MTTGSETDPYRRNLIVYRRHIRSVGSSWNVTHWQRGPQVITTAHQQGRDSGVQTR